MSNELLNTILLSVFLLAAGGGGYYVTGVKQPERLATVEAEIEAIEQQAAEVQGLIAEEAAASQDAGLTLQRWNTRYKVLPNDLSSADVVSFLNVLSSRGFNRFDLSLSGLSQGDPTSHYTYQITGEAYFESLYAFVWHLENGRGLYRVRDLSIKKNVTTIPSPGGEGPGRQVVLAGFSMAVDAFFSVNQDISAPDSAVVPPPEAFPARRAPINPFFPYILDELPPNTNDLVDVETDELVSVIGGTAVFEHGGELRQLRAGDRVYLGRVSNVDPTRARVTIQLNKGGIQERVEIGLDTGERYRQHLGRTSMSPGSQRVPAGPVLDEAPPAPGTPEARERGLYEGTTGDTVPRRPEAYRPVPIGND